MNTKETCLWFYIKGKLRCIILVDFRLIFWNWIIGVYLRKAKITPGNVTLIQNNHFRLTYLQTWGLKTKKQEHNIQSKYQKKENKTWSWNFYPETSDIVLKCAFTLPKPKRAKEIKSGGIWFFVPVWFTGQVWGRSRVRSDQQSPTIGQSDFLDNTSTNLAEEKNLRRWPKLDPPY